MGPRLCTLHSCKTRCSPHSPVQVLIQRFVRIFIAFDAPHEILRGLVTITIDIVRATQFHLLQEPGTEQGHIRAGGHKGPETKETAGGVVLEARPRLGHKARGQPQGAGPIRKSPVAPWSKFSHWC